MLRYLVMLLLLAGAVCAAPVSKEEAGARLKMAMQIARETNDRSLVAGVTEVQRELSNQASPLDDKALRAIEEKVGIAPGGWSMAGQPLFRPEPEMLHKLAGLRPQLEAAMKSADPAKVRRVVAEMAVVFGSQAGVPDGRRKGTKLEVKSISEREAAQLYVAALDGEGARVRSLREGNLIPGQMARFYADVLTGLCEIRGSVEKWVPQAVPEVDSLARGCARILMGLQQPSGHFPFPDLRGENIRFGSMIEKQVSAGAAEVKDGWVISPDPDGGTQFDTGVCGVGLLLAGRLYKEESWRQAGLRAADWALRQDCVRNFNYNAFSVSLLAAAFRESGEPRYLEGALLKFRVGVAPGQAANGRWIDPHNARTVYHVIILRALGDIAGVVPHSVRPEIDAVAEPAIKAILDEFDTMGITVDALPELHALYRLYPANQRLASAVQHMKTVIVAKSTRDDRRVKMGASPRQLAAVALGD